MWHIYLQDLRIRKKTSGDGGAFWLLPAFRATVTPGSSSQWMFTLVFVFISSTAATYPCSQHPIMMRVGYHHSTVDIILALFLINGLLLLLLFNLPAFWSCFYLCLQTLSLSLGLIKKGLPWFPLESPTKTRLPGLAGPGNLSTWLTLLALLQALHCLASAYLSNSISLCSESPPIEGQGQCLIHIFSHNF